MIKLQRCIAFLSMAFLWLAGGAAEPSDAGGRRTLSGTVVHAVTGAPVAYAAVALDGGERWTVTGEKGAFTLKNVPAGEVTLTVTCLGYAKRTVKVPATGDVPELAVELSEDNLLLEEVTVTARAGRDEATSSYIIDRASLEHLQMADVADAMSLLPGGQTNRTLHMASSDDAYYKLYLRNARGEDGSPSFTTAVEVDGVRLSSNAAFGTAGVDTRTIATANVSSIEVVTGIPSVQYGDLSNGIVKINTAKGKSPLHVEAATKPNTKQLALRKGFALGRDAGVLNAALEYTKSVSDLASPYTSYVRNGLSLRYSNTFNRRSRPLTLETGLAGTLGGYHSKGDPDRFVNTYSKVRGNTLRGNVRASWLPDWSWLTGLEGQFSAYYSDDLRESSSNKSSSSSVAAVHGTDEGYFVATRYDDNPAAPVVLIPAGYWYQTAFTDSKTLNLSANIKGNWTRHFGRLRSNLLLGADFTSSGNLGRGLYYDDLRYAPSGWRPYRFDEVPFMNNLAWYVEEKAQLPTGGATSLQLMAGLRSDITFVKASRYGTVSSLSPRFSARYTLIDRPAATLFRRLALTAGWGKAVKLPSFDMLYPRPDYRDILSFAPGTMADGTSFTAYYIMPHTTDYNPDLRWQYSRQLEIGVEANIRRVFLSLSFFRHQTVDPYTGAGGYLPFSYKITGQEALENSAIPSANRMYTIDRTTGVVTVTDITGAQPPEILAYRERQTFRSTSTMTNGTPFVRRGLEWVADFGKIPLLQTSVRIDGSWYRYRSTDETIVASSPTGQNMADGSPYKYVGYYVGAGAIGNGFETKKLNANLTLTTHIPAIRIILSLRLEVTLYNFKQNLSEYSGGARGFAIDNRGDNFPAADPSIYNTDRYVALYPLYYTTYDDMETRIPFAEKFAWAYANDRPLYNELSKLVVSSNTDYYFNAAKKSAYYFVNLSVTKELGDWASLSFSAVNFTNNAMRVTSSDNNTQNSIYNTSSSTGLIPAFYYSLSLRLKL
jgi:hypothetical protein